MKLSCAEKKVLAVLVDEYGDFGHFPFRPLMKRTGLTRAIVRRACRSLKRKGLAAFSNALWSGDGEPCGAGYGATPRGKNMLEGAP